MKRSFAPNAAAWKKRWNSVLSVIDSASPFGKTDEGMHDYRGATLANATFTNITARYVDLSCADLRGLTVESCLFVGCRFEGARLAGLSAWSSKFEDCVFKNADLTLAHIGFNGTELTRCRFDRAKVSGVGFINAVFRETDFHARDWNGTDFGASGFWDCKFSGDLQDITFRGSYLIELDDIEPPKHTGLHQVDFSDATLRWVNVDGGCKLENLTLPSDGSAFICAAEDLLSLEVLWQQGSDYRRVLTDYLGTIQLDPAIQKQKIISKRDLIGIGGEDIGNEIYSVLISKLGSHQ